MKINNKKSKNKKIVLTHAEYIDNITATDTIFEKLTTKENIIIFSLILVIIIIVFSLLKKYDPFKEINYNKVGIGDILSNSVVEKDRDVYLTLNEIVLNILASDSENETISNAGEGKIQKLNYEYDIKDYYETLTRDYKSYLSKREYTKLITKIVDDYDNNYEIRHIVSQKVPIRRVYKYRLLKGDYYIVELNTSTNNYIGIKLIPEELIYSIFYLQ